MTIIPIRDLKNTVEIERLCFEEKGPVFITKNGYGKLVVMDIKYYEQTIGKLVEARQINEGLEDIKTGKLKDGKTVMMGLADKYGL